MNNPINDIPVYTPPYNNNTLFNTFEVWLQGRINTCVAGHASRIERLEERIEDLSRAVNVQADRVQKMLVPETMDADALLNKLRGAIDWVEAAPMDELVGSSEFREAIREEVFEGRALTEAVIEIIQDDIRFDVSVK